MTVPEERLWTDGDVQIMTTVMFVAGVAATLVAVAVDLAGVWVASVAGAVAWRAHRAMRGHR